jgi:hypothetical protein
LLKKLFTRKAHAEDDDFDFAGYWKSPPKTKRKSSRSGKSRRMDDKQSFFGFFFTIVTK